jgi:serine/threonine-protein kinase
VSDVTVLLADEVTRLTPAAARQEPGSGGASSRTPSSPSGWLTSSGSIDHGRFGPGMVLDNRYRVLGLLGRGGMGEVYRADDLRLGQQVALKFLPPNLSSDPVRLAQFHNEVRTARTVSHANVCRVYDIGEIDGQLFITMEYVDGEDLSILLRRIGRLPEDKGLEIARQICAGLAAAHERRVLHRDLKPANIMLDGTGRVRIMDFSLASVGEVTDIRAGTPAYMAPEQLSGQEVTVRSDIYALGLVLYEIFTGRRAFEAKTLTELIEQHQAGRVTAPTAIVKALDPAIEMAIVRCVDRDPARRPASAIRVSASLPGGDPLAAALAAGETPSPEMVAAAGGDSAMMTPLAGGMWLAAVAALVLATTAIVGRTSLLARVPLAKPALVLADRAEELRQSFGFADPMGDHASGYFHDDTFLKWAADHGSGKARWAELADGRPAALRFWYRTSPRALLPIAKSSPVSPSDPPLQLNGMTITILDTKGRLLRFEAAPPQVETAATAPAASVDWSKLFAAAGLDRSAFAEAAPSRTPATYADERKAWTGTMPETTIPVTIEAAGYRGRPVLFGMVAPWSTALREPGPPARPGGNPIFIFVLLGGAVLAAYANVRRGRADRQGAFRLAAFTFFLLAAIWVIAPHVNDVAEELQRLFTSVGLALFVAGALYLIYLGLEPFVRRSWPSMLVGWSRLLGGRLRDPLIGRDVLVGAACGAALALLSVAAAMLPARLGLPEPIPHTTDVGPLLSARGVIGTILMSMNIGLQNALITVFEFALLRAFFEWATHSGLRWSGRRWAWAGKLAMSDKTSERVFVALVLAMVTLLAFALGDRTGGQRLLDVCYEAIVTIVILVVLLRIGIFASAIMFFVQFVLLRMPLTFDGNAVYASGAWLTAAGILALAAAGFWMARARGSLIADR